ncbi:hypothetical protein FPV67DRAFT_1666131 [Lyophyllum atratum]|nr:hypothetical protein FPV67DRAFT_1666131 [Lyophyllum atratum]
MDRMTAPLLPATGDDLLFSTMTPRELVRYGQTSRSHHHVMTSYVDRAFNVGKVLSPYFKPKEIPVFRQWQHRLGMIVTGSTSLQLFARVEYEKSDLDIVVKHANAMDVGVFLSKAGYDFYPSQYQETTFDASLAHPEMVERDTIPYKTKSVVAVYTFLHSDRAAKVQVITTHCAPVQVVLEFHSTTFAAIVMTFITHAACYCLYPVSTLEEQTAFVTVDDIISARPALDKYIERGFRERTRVPQDDADNDDHELGGGPRFVGDKHCFVVPIDSSYADAFDSVKGISWKQNYNNRHNLRIQTFAANYPGLHHSVSVATKELAEQVRSIVHGTVGTSSTTLGDVDVLLFLEDANRHLRE